MNQSRSALAMHRSTNRHPTKLCPLSGEIRVLPNLSSVMASAWKSLSTWPTLVRQGLVRSGVLPGLRIVSVTPNRPSPSHVSADALSTGICPTCAGDWF